MSLTSAARPSSRLDDCPHLLSPANKTDVGPNVKLEWSALSGVTGYELQYTQASDTAFNNPTSASLKRKTTSIELSNLQDVSYIWRVRALGKQNATSPWSDVWQFNVIVLEQAPVEEPQIDTPPPPPQPDTPPPPPPPETVVGPPVPLGTTGAWALKFEDNFEGSALDLTKWRPNWIGSSDTAITPPINTRELSCYDPAQASVADGVLKLAAVSVVPGSRSGCVTRSGANANYASGIITSYQDYRFTHGFMEARVWLPPGASTPQNWPAFWANGTGSWPTTGEIDVMEVLAGKLKWHFHYADSSGVHRSYGGGEDTIPNVGGWHTFGANWQSDKITYYYDGKVAGTVTANITNSEMYLILNLGLSSDISPPVVIPSEMQVDYVRVWQ